MSPNFLVWSWGWRGGGGGGGGGRGRAIKGANFRWVKDTRTGDKFCKSLSADVNMI